MRRFVAKTKIYAGFGGAKLPLSRGVLCRTHKELGSPPGRIALRKLAHSLGLAAVCYLLAIILSPTLSAQQPPDNSQPLATVDHPARQANLKGIDAEWRCQLQLASGTQSVDLSDLVYWGGVSRQVDASIVNLRDTGQIVADVRTLNREAVGIASKLWQPAELPRHRIASILFSIDSNERARNQWLDKLSQPVDIDRVWLNGGDFYDAPIIAISNNGNKLLLGDEDQFEVELTRVKAIAFAPQLVRPVIGDPKAWISLLDGSSLPVTSFIASDSGLILNCDQFRMETKQQNGLSIWQLVCGLRPWSSNKFKFLSDVPVVRYEYAPYLHGDWQYQMDRSVVGSRLRVGDMVYDRGIGMHSKSNLVFALDKPFERLDFEIAMDPSAGKRGSVVCRVLTLNDQNVWQPAYRSEIIRGGQKPVSGSADLRGARAIALTVDFADNADILDRANWIMPRLIQ